VRWWRVWVTAFATTRSASTRAVVAVFVVHSLQKTQKLISQEATLARTRLPAQCPRHQQDKLASRAKPLQEIEAEMPVDDKHTVDDKHRRESGGCETDRLRSSLCRVMRSWAALEEDDIAIGLLLRCEGCRVGME
jgi:hypothetical protein